MQVRERCKDALAALALVLVMFVGTRALELTTQCDLIWVFAGVDDGLQVTRLSAGLLQDLEVSDVLHAIFFSGADEGDGEVRLLCVDDIDLRYDK